MLADTARASVAAGQLTAPDIQSRGERRIERSQIIDALLGPHAWTLRCQSGTRTRRRSLARSTRSASAARNTRICWRRWRWSFHGPLNAARAARDLVALARDETLPLAEQNIEAARQAYRAGEQNVVALIDAQKALIAQRRQYVETQRDYAVAVAELHRALGGETDAATDDHPSDKTREE